MVLNIYVVKIQVSWVQNNYAVCIDERKSTISYPFNMDSGVILWISKKEPTTTLSSIKESA